MELEDEKIMISAPKFGFFFKHSALVPYNDAFKDYIDKLIGDEMSKCAEAQVKTMIRSSSCKRKGIPMERRRKSWTKEPQYS